MIDVLKSLIKQFMPFAQEKMGFDRPPKLFLRDDPQNAANPLGKTGFYDPQAESITLYTTGRHPKDIMRSLAHELQHHTQKCNGDFENVQNMGEEGYAQNNPHMRTMEIQAYQASIVFRDWEDSCKGTIYYEHLQKGDKSSMSTKNWKNGELKSLLSEAWGFKMDLRKLNESGAPPRAEKERQQQETEEQEEMGELSEEETLEEYSASGVNRGSGDKPSDKKAAKKETEGTEDSKREEEGLKDPDKDHDDGDDKDERCDYIDCDDDDEELEEDRSRGRKAPNVRGKEGEHNLRPEGKKISEAQARRIIAKVLKERRKKGK